MEEDIRELDVQQESVVGQQHVIFTIPSKELCTIAEASRASPHQCTISVDNVVPQYLALARAESGLNYVAHTSVQLPSGDDKAHSPEPEPQLWEWPKMVASCSQRSEPPADRSSTVPAPPPVRTGARPASHTVVTASRAVPVTPLMEQHSMLVASELAATQSDRVDFRQAVDMSRGVPAAAPADGHLPRTLDTASEDLDVVGCDGVAIVAATDTAATADADTAATADAAVYASDSDDVKNIMLIEPHAVVSDGAHLGKMGPAMVFSRIFSQHKSNELRPFDCNECDFTCNDRLQLASHDRLHGDGTPLQCRNCGRMFHHSAALLRHARVHLPRPLRCPPIVAPPSPHRSVKCGVCSDEFDEQDMRNSHIGYWWCSLCERVFGLQCQLDRHGCVTAASIKQERSDSPQPPMVQKHKRKPGRPRKIKHAEHSPTSPDKRKTDESARLPIPEEHSEAPEAPMVTLALDVDPMAVEPVPARVKLRRPRKLAVPIKQELEISEPEESAPDSESDPEWTGEIDAPEVSDDDEPSVSTKPAARSAKCDICGKAFRNHNSLARHLVRHINENTSNPSAPSERKRRSTSSVEPDGGSSKADTRESQADIDEGELPVKFTCKACGAGFHSRASLQRHKQTEHGETRIRYQCELCPMSYDRSDLITRHTIKEHGQQRTHKCSRCKACFTQASLLETHMKLHERKRQFVPYRNRAKCNVCKQRFSSSELKAQHECAGPRARVICDVCGRSCASEAVLRRHQMLHMAVRPCACDTCGARFVDKYALRAHVKIHMPDRPHVCHICARGFKARGLLKRHMQFHTDERPFVCDHCGKAFKAANQLQNHIRIHTGEKPFPCTVCGKPFRQAQQLKTHMKTHDPNKPHKAPKREEETWVQDLLLGSMRTTL